MTQDQKQKSKTSFFIFWEKEKYKFFTGLVSTTLAILIALLVNSAVHARAEKNTYQTMIKAIKAEAKGNREILTKSFLPNYENGVVLRSFDDSYAESCMKQEIFIKNATDTLINILTSYKLEIQRANAYRVANEKLRFDQKGINIWGDNLRIAWEASLENIDFCLKQIEQYKE